MNTLIENLGWALLHSLWEGALIGLGLQLTMATLRRSAAQSRYLAGCVALTLAVLAPWVTFIRLEFHPVQVAAQAVVPGQTSVVDHLAVLAAPAPPVAMAAPWADRMIRQMAVILPWVVAGWAVGCGWSFVALGMGWKAAGRLQRSPRRSLGKEVEQRCRELARRLGIGQIVQIGESAMIEVPSVVSWLKPIILVPIGAFSGLSAEQVDGILAHELAHIARNDFAVNLLQSACEVLFFYHPAIHAINRHIRSERENACDDIAGELTGDVRNYATALAKLEDARSSLLTLAATGEGSLLPRIRRLLGAPAVSRRRLFPDIWAVGASAVVYLGILLVTPGIAGRILAEQPSAIAVGPIASDPVPASGALGQKVRIQVIIANVILSGTDQSGINSLSLTVGPNGKAGTTRIRNFSEEKTVRPFPDGTAATFDLSNGVVDPLAFNAAMKATASDGKNRVHVLHSVVLITANQKKAEVTLGEQVPTIEIDGERTTTAAIDLSVTPTVGDGGEIELNIDQKVGDFDEGTTTVPGEERKTIVTHREVKSLLAVKDGQMVVLGGLQKTGKTTGERTETLFFLRPMVVH